MRVLGVGAAAALVLTGCSEKSTGDSEATGTDGAGGLSIQPVMQIDAEGKEVPSTDTTAAADPAGDGSATCPQGTSIAMAGALTGPNAALGINILNGAKLAIDQHNKANPGCQIELKPFDTEGNPQKATQVIPQIVNDPTILGLVGPAFSGETKATGQILSDAGLVSVSSSATNASLTQNGWQSFFRGLANDDVQGPSVANYMVSTAGYKKVCVVQDNTDYGTGLAASVTAALGPVADPACAASIKEGDKDFSATVTKISSVNPDAIFYSGYYAEAAPLAQQLKSGGVDATFVSADGSNDPQFVSQAGSSATGAVLSCPCGPAPEEFTTEYEALNGQAPGVYSVEAYDLATILAMGIDDGKLTRPDLLAFVRGYDGAGLARQYKWNPDGELSNALIWVYEVK
ncbi:branched-chain amino acid ABC transporter substrate-binding protein [Nocardia cyriacigeorgica]|uniref:Branched-chain amino acid ABC transporter substrate-binding protein n=1 Tax=Nocardia cyriacigeorgica TaxID=135487 RepID=A0A6P1DC34_9NOCA|nr:branched-chain amino acid ABC transporter substrate-binding protein [Nocardia cyriacigeorgica]NEW41558.1 branched-chain amino acid ABC transporter substrate-binding protein [Nocardia cyriacigeorgica]NEW47748.1 branched-chain amino acid ABC transporter substrate-binding protein [Nocardia cyriacigeorgica]NEW52368.1 branched-chain amino acid ABC transporter substrate-binding protein [Nocardia cyriacigeorgica]NEW56353.1 branched-chain amino acid ABC transporter substrate-binding protein [Nocardi